MCPNWTLQIPPVCVKAFSSHSHNAMSSQPLETAKTFVQTEKCICLNCKMYVLVQITKCVDLNCKMYLTKLLNVPKLISNMYVSKL